MKKIALFGGTFDPIHNGHLLIAEQIREKHKIDEIWFCPNYSSVDKDISFFSPKERLYLVEQACLKIPYFKVLDFEIERQGYSYTIDTINEIYKKKKIEQLFLILSDDLFQNIKKWKNSEEILKKVEIILFDRYKKENEFILLPVSSTLIKERLVGNRSLKFLVPECVENYLKTRNFTFHD